MLSRGIERGNAVPHPSSNRTLRCLTAAKSRGPENSTDTVPHPSSNRTLRCLTAAKSRGPENSTDIDKNDTKLTKMTQN